jgi:hypothetical protein
MARAATRARVSKVRTAGPGYGKRRQVNVRPTFWQAGEFVAIDGEGFSDGKPFELSVGANKTRYTGREHFYAYLAASDGSERYNPNGRIGMLDCLAFLCAIVERNPFAVLVAFGGSYDVTHMVAHDLDRNEITRLLGKAGKSKLVIEGGGFVYVLEYRPRKCFTIQRWLEGERRWTEKNGKRVSTPHLTVRLWDVWGFFQDSFTGVLDKWLPADPDRQFITRMKGERSVFERSEIAEIKRYNAAELRCLVKVMNRVRDAINDLGLKITRWDGAGAVAAAMMQKHKVKAHKRDLPPHIFEAARRAYSGGHIEACKIGYHWGDIHHYDVNSAYPDQFRHLPSLQNGEWISGDGEPPPGYTLVQIEWQFPEGLPFYPLFYRCEDGSIIYPYRGSGWYWFAEFNVARTYYARSVKGLAVGQGHFKVRTWHHFREYAPERPFGWVADYYTQRQRYITAARAGGFVSGPEKIIKLGLNSLYGKTAQQVGAREDKEGNLRLPPFFQLDWAGYVTAGCRAKLMEAAIQKPSAIIGFATDGLFSTEPLDLYTPHEKELGAWEYQRHDGITMVMPGVYWLHDGEKVQHYSRGFDKKEMSDAAFIHLAWQRKQDSVAVKLTRLVGLGSAIGSRDYWKMRGNFTSSTRRLCLDGDNSKRYPINLRIDRPHLGLVNTTARDHFLPNLFGIPESAPYPVAWLDGVLERDLLEGEMADELEAQDAALA